MDDDDKADLARQGLEAAELLEPGKIAEKMKGSMKEAAGDAVLQGVAAIGRLTGKKRSPARAAAARAVDIGDALGEWDAADAANFEERVHAAAAKKARDDQAKHMQLATLRASFPEEARPLALLIFNCVDLLEDLSEDAEGAPPSAIELARKEELLVRLAEMLAPNAGDSLRSFVDHVVKISRSHRASGG